MDFLELLKMGLTFYVKAKNMAGVINVSLLLQLTKGKKIVCFFIIFIILISMMMNVILFMKILFLFVISIRN